MVTLNMKLNNGLFSEMDSNTKNISENVVENAINNVQKPIDLISLEQNQRIITSELITKRVRSFLFYCCRVERKTIVV